jgi:hypothetical protein
MLRKLQPLLQKEEDLDEDIARMHQEASAKRTAPAQHNKVAKPAAGQTVKQVAKPVKAQPRTAKPADFALKDFFKNAVHQLQEPDAPVIPSSKEAQ